MPDPELPVPGPLNLITDVPGLMVGNASDPVLKTGVTVLTADRPFVAGVDIRGGAPGTREIALLSPDKLVSEIDALVLSGGSAFGLDAAGGVMAGLAEEGRGFTVRDITVPIVPAAILFDLANGGDKTTVTTAYRALGAEALRRALPGPFDIGSVGAGTGALTAQFKGGLGSASAQLPCGTMVGALVAANPVGCVCPPGSRHFWAAPFEEGDEFGGHGPEPGRPKPITASDLKAYGPGSERAATTIAIVATDAPLDKAGATRLAVAAQDGLARAIVPAHTPRDGDLVFAVSTGGNDRGLDPALLGHLAATVLARAIARAIFAATPMAGDIKPVYSASRP